LHGKYLHSYYFSSNSEFIKTKNGPNVKQNNGRPLTPSHYKNMDWPRYLVWTKAQKNSIKESSQGNPKIEITGPIWAYDSEKAIPKIPPKSVAVFDVPPRRNSIYASQCDTSEIYSTTNVIKFLDDIFNCFIQEGWTVIFKTKRNAFENKNLSKRYLKKVEQYALHKRFRIVDSSIAAQKIINKSKLTISLPYTSTAFIAQNYKKPSYFYDASSSIEKDDPAASGIRIISGTEELLKIIKSQRI